MENNFQLPIDFFENAPITFSIFDENLRVVYMNKEAMKLFKNETKETLVGKHLEEIAQGVRETGRLALYEKVMKTGAPLQMRSVVLTPNLGSKNMGLYAFKAGAGLAIIGIEVTEWIADEKKMIVQLEQKNKELEQFAYIASHDLQEPLETVLSFIGVMQKKYESSLDANATKYMGFIVNAARRMQQLVRDILEYSRVGKSEKNNPVNLNDVLKEVLLDLDASIKANQATIKVSSLPVLNSNEADMKQLFQNLISNAIKYRKKDIPPVITIDSEKENGFWKFSVADNGIGIDEKFSERIFVIFQRLHNRSEYEGTGIGLSLCKKIVELNGGKIRMKSEPGTGTTFYFTLKI